MFKANQRVNDPGAFTTQLRFDEIVLEGNQPPTANADTATTDEDIAVDIDVLANDTDIDSDPIVVSSVTQGTHGAVTINPNGTVKYAPDPDFNGVDSFDYTITDGPESCQDIRDADDAAADGDFLIFPAGSNGQGFSVFCNDMAGAPSEYLTLINTGGNFNYSQYTAGGASPSTTNVRTSYTKVRLDPATLTVNIGDQTFSSSTGFLFHSPTTRGNVFPVSSMPYGVAIDCRGSFTSTGQANIDLTGTPFQVDDSFRVSGFNAAGSVNGVPGTGPALGQVVNLTGGGFCGGTHPLPPGNQAPRNNGGGFNLSLAFVGPSAGTAGTDTATVDVTINPGDLIIPTGTTLTLTEDTIHVNVIIEAGGILNAGSSTLTVLGDFTVNGTFNADTSMVAFNGTEKQTITGKPTYHRMEVDKTTTDDATKQLVGDGVKVEEELKVMKGQYEPGNSAEYKNVKLVQTGKMKPQASSTYYVKGDWTQEATASYTAYGSKIDFNGISGRQNLIVAGVVDMDVRLSNPDGVLAEETLVDETQKVILNLESQLDPSSTSTRLVLSGKKWPR